MIIYIHTYCTYTRTSTRTVHSYIHTFCTREHPHVLYTRTCTCCTRVHPHVLCMRRSALAVRAYIHTCCAHVHSHVLCTRTSTRAVHAHINTYCTRVHRIRRQQDRSRGTLSGKQKSCGTARFCSHSARVDAMCIAMRKMRCCTGAPILFIAPRRNNAPLVYICNDQEFPGKLGKCKVGPFFLPQMIKREEIFESN